MLDASAEIEDQDIQNGILNFDLENIRLKRLAESKAIEDGDSPVIAIQSEYDDDDQDDPDDGIEDLLYKKSDQMDLEEKDDLDEIEMNQEGDDIPAKNSTKAKAKKAKKVSKAAALPDRENENSTISVEKFAHF